jgi:hypothetical protein
MSPDCLSIIIIIPYTLMLSVYILLFLIHSISPKTSPIDNEAYTNVIPILTDSGFVFNKIIEHIKRNSAKSNGALLHVKGTFDTKSSALGLLLKLEDLSICCHHVPFES